MDVFKAVSRNDYRQVLDFLNAGGDPNIMEPAPGGGADSLLRNTMNIGTNDILLLLLEAGADPNLGMTVPLDIAVTGARLDKIRILLGAGADPNHQNPYGVTPLHFAAVATTRIAEHYDAIRLLLDAGADPTLTNTRGMKPSQVATNPKIKELLEEAEYAWNHPWIPEEQSRWPAYRRMEQVSALSAFRERPGRTVLPRELQFDVLGRL